MDGMDFTVLGLKVMFRVLCTFRNCGDNVNVRIIFLLQKYLL